MNAIESRLQSVKLWDVVKATCTIGAVVLAALLAYRFYYILFAVMVAIMIYLAIRPLVELLNRIGINKRIGMIIGYVVVVLLIAGFLLLLIPLLLNQARTITDKLPEYYTLLKGLLTSSNIPLLQLFASYLPAELSLDRIPTLFLSVPEDTSGSGNTIVPVAVSPTPIFSTLFLVVAIFAMAYYWMRDRDKIVYHFLLFFPSTHRDTVEKLIEEMEQTVGSFYQGQLILCAVVGGACFVAYWLVGLPYALTLGAFAFVFEAVPMIGPMLGAVPAILIALTISPTLTAEVVAINAVVQFVENNVLVPRIMGRTVGVNPILTVLAIAAFTILFGLVGALLAVPLAAMIQVIIERTIFHFRPESKEESSRVADPNPLLMTTPTVAQRNRFSVMRVEAQDLANDIRKRMRQAEDSVSSESTQIEEMIEALAIEFDQALAKRESSARGI
ncbi:MAG: AI-2E family transporter [Caldilineaceae bacterium]